MKFLRLTFAAVFAFAFGNAYAFHSGGVAECEGCHTMHNSFEGERAKNEDGSFAGQGSLGNLYQAGPYLLRSSSKSGACLNCHENNQDTAPSSYHISTGNGVVTLPTALIPSSNTTQAPPMEMTPGGDFAWLKYGFTFSVRKTAETEEGERHGHNIVATEFGYNADGTLATAPGGTYPAAQLACSSCHDPHGRYRRFADGSIATTGLPIFNSGSYNNSANPIDTVSAVGVYRILGGSGYLPKSMSTQAGLAFANPPPAAVAPSTYNRSESTSQTRVAYGQGMSEWCANCHGGLLMESYTSGAMGLRHPAGNSAKLNVGWPGMIYDNYNQYTTSGRTATAATANYSSLVPFEIGNANYAALKTQSSTGTSNALAADANSNVMCLSCHRAHATGFESMTRYNLVNEFMTIADSTNAAAYDSSTTEGKINHGKNVTIQTAAYYGRPASAFGPYARNLCNKCHAKD